MRLILHLLSLMIRGTALMLSFSGAVLALAALGGAVNNKLDVLTHFTPAWLALAAAGVVLGTVAARGGERWAMIGLGALGVAASLALMGPDLLKAAAPLAPPGGRQLKLIQFNVWGSNTAPEKTRDWILAQDADVVVIEEGGGAIVRGLRDRYRFAMSCAGEKKGGCDSWIFSRWPILDGGGMGGHEGGFPGVWATLADPDGAFTLAGAHYTWPAPAGRQQKQSRYLVKFMSRFSKDTTILTGDFNSTPWSFSLRRQDKALGLERRTRALATWPAGAFSRIADAPAPLLPIDHVYAGTAWRTVSVERGPVLGSDHRPVIVVLRRRPANDPASSAPD